MQRRSSARIRSATAGPFPHASSGTRLSPPCRPYATLPAPHNARHQLPPRSPRRPRLRRPRRLRHESQRRHPSFPVGTEPGTCGQGSERETNYAVGATSPGSRSSRVCEQRSHSGYVASLNTDMSAQIAGEIGQPLLSIDGPKTERIEI